MQKFNMSHWKSLFLGTVVAILFLIVSCRDNQLVAPKGLAEAQMPLPVKERLASLMQQYPKSKFVVILFEGEGKATFQALTQRKDYCSMSPLVIFEEKKGSQSAFMERSEYRIVELGDRISRIKQLPRDPATTVTYADELASPEIGFDGFGKRLGEVLRYPDEARRKGIEGTVMVECLITTDGRMSDAKVINGLADNVDAEALRAVMLVGGSWNPAVHEGRIVNQKLVIPVRFALN